MILWYFGSVRNQIRFRFIRLSNYPDPTLIPLTTWPNAVIRIHGAN